MRAGHIQERLTACSLRSSCILQHQRQWTRLNDACYFARMLMSHTGVYDVSNKHQLSGHSRSERLQYTELKWQDSSIRNFTRARYWYILLNRGWWLATGVGGRSSTRICCGALKRSSTTKEASVEKKLPTEAPAVNRAVIDPSITEWADRPLELDSWGKVSWHVIFTFHLDLLSKFFVCIMCVGNHFLAQYHASILVLQI